MLFFGRPDIGGEPGERSQRGICDHSSAHRAGVVGAVIGWVLYYINRYRKDVVIGDLATIAGAIGAGTGQLDATGQPLSHWEFGWRVLLPSFRPCANVKV